MTLLNTFEGTREAVSREHLSIFLRLLAPFAPHLSEELWSRLEERGFIHKAPWPSYDPKLIHEETFELVVQVNGKVRDRVSAPVGIDEKTARELVLNRPKVKAHLPRGPKKVIFVPGRLINLVG